MKRAVLLLDFTLILTVSQAQTGVPLWTNRFDGPGFDYANAIAVDGSGNAFVAGSSLSPLGGDPSHSDYLTVAYSNGGLLLWSNRFHGPAYGDNVASAVAVDKGGRVFVAGNAGIVAYSNSGVALWTNLSAPAVAMALDGRGNVFTTGSFYNGGYSDWVTVAISSDGGTLWTNRTGLLYDDFARNVAVDPDGNILVAGTWTWPTGFYDFTVVKYSAIGLPLWTNHFDSPMHWDDIAAGLAVANDGTAFLTGRSANSGVFSYSVYDYATVAFLGDGTPLWTNRYDGPASVADVPTAITVDNQGNVIITGESAGDAYGFDYTTIKYSGTGAPLWTNRYHRLGSINNSATALAVDKDGNVVVTGSSYLNGYNDYATVLYSNAGMPVWTNVYSGPIANGDDVARAIATDCNGNIFVTGYSWGVAGPDLVTIKYSSSVRPFLTMHRVDNQLVLDWPRSDFSLQSAPTITATFTNLPGATSPYTNTLNREQQFFRLISN